MPGHLFAAAQYFLLFRRLLIWAAICFIFHCAVYYYFRPRLFLLFFLVWPKINGAFIIISGGIYFIILCAFISASPPPCLYFCPPLCSGRFALKNNHAINRSIVSVVTLQELFSCLGILYLFLPVGFCFCVFSLGKNKNKIINRRRILLFSAILFFIGEFCFG